VAQGKFDFPDDQVITSLADKFKKKKKKNLAFQKHTQVSGKFRVQQ
jgi:hypothetical protein